MSIGDKLSYALGRRDQGPNKALAKRLVEEGGTAGLSSLVDFIETKPHRRLQMDAMLTMAWVAEQKPEMLVQHVQYLIEKLCDPIDRVSWGSMIALSYVSRLVPDKMYEAMPQILDAMDQGSIVGRDHGFRILINLYRIEKYRADLFFIVLEQIKKAPQNQLGQYTERLLEVIDNNHLQDLMHTLEQLREELSSEHHLKRLDKNLSKIHRKMN